MHHSPDSVPNVLKRRSASRVLPNIRQEYVSYENHVHHGLMSAGAQRCGCSLRRLDVLVHAEQVRRVVPLLHLR
jgi:hypothetical protein